MAQSQYKYALVGGGLAAASAVKGIREVDSEGTILLLGREDALPYDRPPLSKELWLGKKTLDEIVAQPGDYYGDNNVDLALGVAVIALDPGSKTITDTAGNTIGYEKLLLATGGTPRALSIPGGDLEGVCYYRTLTDYHACRAQATERKSAVVIGGGFIGSEMAAALTANGVNVTLIFPDAYLVSRVLPEPLGSAITESFRAHGVNVMSGDAPAAIERSGGRLVTQTREGKRVESDMVIVGIGIVPEVALAEAAGLAVGNGIVVNELLQTSDPDIYAAGDNAFFPYLALGENMRIEHWDNAKGQGKQAGRNMAGAGEPFTYMPYFFSDLFEFSYEAVGDLSSRLDTVANWQKEYDTGVVYYLRDRRVRGVMMCNVWKKRAAARELIQKGETVTPEELRGAIA